MKLIKFIFALLSLLIGWSVLMFHLTDLKSPVSSEEIALVSQLRPEDIATWVDKKELGIHQLILQGKPFLRGWATGIFVKDILLKQETELIAQFNVFFPGDLLQKAFQVVGIRWFWGIEKYFKPDDLQEMYGVSLSAPSEFNYLLPPYTRQITYHGLHEVGQMMVDQGGDSMGCTVLALPYKDKWVLGRNFDFEGGRIFDTEKVMKSVFPDKGYAFLSVIWAGMVGAVTGVNEKGVYISINAAGSEQYRRYGVPSTLLVLEVLQFAKTADEAVEILKKAQMFITDIFVVTDNSTGKLYRVEKSPRYTEVISLSGPSVVTNHLISERWSEDSINKFRANELTSHYRESRGKYLMELASKAEFLKAEDLDFTILNGLRDKGEENGVALHLGNRRAIDALIATHSVIYNQVDNIFYVSKGPGVSGEFIGFDLKSSFAKHRPTVVKKLPEDQLVSAKTFGDVRESAKLVSKAMTLIRKKKCDEAEVLLGQSHQLFEGSSGYYQAIGNLYECRNQLDKAKVAWRKALDLFPAYAKDEKYLKLKVSP